MFLGKIARISFSFWWELPSAPVEDRGRELDKVTQPLGLDCEQSSHLTHTWEKCELCECFTEEQILLFTSYY